MSWFRDLFRRREEESRGLLVRRIARFRRVLRSYGRFLDLVTDAAEKQGGDFVLDRSYVLALAERALDAADSMVFDFAVLTGDPGWRDGERARGPIRWERFEERLARLREEIQALLTGPDAPGSPPSGSDEEPEYRLLRAFRRLAFPLTLGEAGPPVVEAEACRSLHDLVHVVHERAGDSLAGLAGIRHQIPQDLEVTSKRPGADAPPWSRDFQVAASTRPRQAGVFRRVAEIVVADRDLGSASAAWRVAARVDAAPGLSFEVLDHGDGFEGPVEPGAVLDAGRVRSVPFRAFLEGVRAGDPGAAAGGAGRIARAAVTEETLHCVVWGPDGDPDLLDARVGAGRASNHLYARFAAGPPGEGTEAPRAAVAGDVLSRADLAAARTARAVSVWVSGLPAPDMEERMRLIGRVFRRMAAGGGPAGEPDGPVGHERSEHE